MPQKPANIHRLEEPEALYINKFWTGLYKNRSPLFTPISALGIQLIARQDVLTDGLNAMITPQFTFKRRYGFSKACTSAFGASEWPLTFFSFENLAGTINQMVDTQTNVYTFTGTTKTSIYTKGTTGQSSFVDVANILYWVDGNAAKKWNGTTVTNIGIASAITAPTLSFGAGALSPTVGFKYVYVGKNSTTGTTSTASPASASTGVQTSKNVTVQGDFIADTQANKIDIYRTKDGGSVYYFLAEIANPGSGAWTYTDSTVDANLNNLLIAPVANVNDPPAAGMSLLVWYAGRLWGASGNTLYFSGGPDTLNGVGEESWPPGNNYTVPGNITALAATNEGLLIWTRDNSFVITGTSAADFTVPMPWRKNFGVPNQNSVAQDGDTLYVHTSKGQIFSVSTNGIEELGFAIQSQIAAFTSANVYIAIHRDGGDEGLFVSDGATNLYRYSLVSNSWDPVYQPVNGVGAIASAELSTNNWSLLMGRPAGSLFILERDLTTYQDDGSSYSGFGTFGSITVAPLRKVAHISSVLLQTSSAGTYPTVAVMLNEVTDTGTAPATFTTLPNPVPDPPLLPASTSVRSKRHDFKAAGSPLPEYVQHMQLKVTFPAENAANELYGFGIA